MSIKPSSLVLAILAAAAAPLAASAADARMRIYNRSSYDIQEIHVAPTYRDHYGRQDLLGTVVLHRGYNILLDFDVADAENECMLDVIAKPAGGVRLEWRKRFNVCAESSWNLYD